MKIQLAGSAGFCFGVKRALNIAFQTAQKKSSVWILGDIVHNEDVIAAVRQAGIKKIKQLKEGQNKTLLIRAHGTAFATFQKAKKLGYEVIDATCPVVKEIHHIARRMEQKGYAIIIIGDKHHDEVRGIVGQLKNKALVIDPGDHIPWQALSKTRKPAVVVQSTQDFKKVGKIVGLLRRRIKNLKFFNTICGPTKIKQKEVKSLARTNDVMIVIGSKTSANTRRLYEISKSLNKKTYKVESKKDIRKEWLNGAKRIGVTAGASTPEATTQEIIAFLKSV
jgi:4-hydroxy-3-methylbut-2-enyl diphosphate reductase